MCVCVDSLPLFIHRLLAAAGGGAAAAGALNISANGLPNCNKSSEALVAADAGAGTPPNMSTMLALELVGDDKNGLLSAADVGDATFV